ncbi:unnamed protein product, partial [Rotaria sp. Silwood1]
MKGILLSTNYPKLCGL